MNDSSLTMLLHNLTEKIRYAGVHRALVTEVDIDNNDYGVIRVFIPTIMTDKDPDIDEGNLDGVGIRALPANNPLGGRNDQDADPNKNSYYQGTVYVPPKGAWVYVFFEGMNPNKPRYMGALDLENTKLPPENRGVDKPHKVYTILKTRQGRTICVADSDDVQRVEITGKKRELTGGPEGDDESTYKIDGNMTTILFDERDTQEKILVRTYKGDYIHIDIDERNIQAYMEHDIIIKNDNEYHWHTAGDIHIKTDKNLYLEAGEDIHVTAKYNIHRSAGMDITDKAKINHKTEAGVDLDHKSGGSMRHGAGATHSIKAATLVGIDGASTNIQSGVAQPAKPSENATKPKLVDPTGDRDETQE